MLRAMMDTCGTMACRWLKDSALSVYPILPILMIIFLFGCEKTADISSPSTYASNGMYFSYPGNWEVTEDFQKDDFRNLFVESPGDALLIIQVYPQKEALSLTDFAESFSEKMSQEVPIGKVEDNEFTSAEKLISSNTVIGINERFSLVLLGERVPHIREYFRLDAAGKAVFIISQTASEDVEKVVPGFNLILSSLSVKGL